MPKKTWPDEAEKFLMEEWHKIMQASQGKMFTKQEKVDLVTRKLNEQSQEEDWKITFVGDQVVNKLDSMAKKAKKTYDKFTKTGSAVEDKFDLQVSMKQT